MSELETHLAYLENHVVELDRQLIEEREKTRKLGVHLSHCNFGEHENRCKYAEGDCPALSESWSWFGKMGQKFDRMRERLEQMQGTPVSRFTHLIEELEKRFPNKKPYSSSHFLEEQALEEIDYLVEFHTQHASPTWVCGGCGRVAKRGWLDKIDEFNGEYDMQCPSCGVTQIEEDSASTLAAERDRFQQLSLDLTIQLAALVDTLEKNQSPIKELTLAKTFLKLS